MGTKYKHEFAEGTVYDNASGLLSTQDIPEGIHLDIGCGYAAIRDGFQKYGMHQLSYVGIDGNAETVSELREEGIEAYHHYFDGTQADLVVLQEILDGRRLVSVTILDMLEHLDESSREGLLQTVWELTRKQGIPLVVSVPNITHRDLSLKLMEGKFDYTDEGILDRNHLHFFTASSVQTMFSDCGFEQLDERDVRWNVTEQGIHSDSTFLAEGTVLHSYLSYIKDTFDPNYNVYQFVRLFHAVPKERAEAQVAMEEEVPKPFLSIVTRTQGMRRDALTETLLCLTGQSNTDFEVLVLGHNIEDKPLQTVLEILEDLPSWMCEKVRYIPVKGGNRTTPLNVGFSQARGEYIAVLDDDDLVFDNWVEEFYQLSRRAPGAVLHAFSIVQEWEAVNSGGAVSLRAIGSPDNRYCVGFDLLKQLAGNRCPNLSYVCPRYAFKELNIRFDEELTTTEDWDFLMRTAFICGVVDTKEATSIYRLWKNYENSQTLHSEEEWNKNRDLLLNRFSENSILLPKGYVSEIIEMENRRAQGAASLYNSGVLYVDDGAGFSERMVLYPHTEFGNIKGAVRFPGIQEIGKVHGIRLDPADSGLLTVRNLQIQILVADGTVIEYNMDSVETNGARYGDTLYFIKNDPQIVLPIQNALKISDVRAEADIELSISDEMVDTIIRDTKVKMQKPTERRWYQKLAHSIRGG